MVEEKRCPVQTDHRSFPMESSKDTRPSKVATNNVRPYAFDLSTISSGDSMFPVSLFRIVAKWWSKVDSVRVDPLTFVFLIPPQNGNCCTGGIGTNSSGAPPPPSSLTSSPVSKSFSSIPICPIIILASRSSTREDEEEASVGPTVDTIETLVRSRSEEYPKIRNKKGRCILRHSRKVNMTRLIKDGW